MTAMLGQPLVHNPAKGSYHLVPCQAAHMMICHCCRQDLASSAVILPVIIASLDLEDVKQMPHLTTSMELLSPDDRLLVLVRIALIVLL